MAEHVALIHTAHAINSLRESSFDTRSALGEVIDNSLQADAKNIGILIDQEEKDVRRGRKPRTMKMITSVAIGDDGCGMDEHTLHHCMQLGFSTRYNDRDGIGRFGVGMTLAAFNQCKRVEVYSKQEDGEWLHAYVDLDEVAKNPFIPDPTKADPPEEYRSTLASDYGTLVVWKKGDRLARSQESYDDIKLWVRRTYRKFLGKQIVEAKEVRENPKPVTITLNEEELTAFDPLYAIHDDSFLSEVVAELVDEIPLQMPVPEDAAVKEKTSTIKIRMSFLPEEWMDRPQKERRKLAESLHIPENEGFSVLRAGREVFYDAMPHFKPTVHPDGYDRWWSAEISFEPALDFHFNVRNIKRGATFVRQLREEIQDCMKGTITEARSRIRDIFKTQVRKQTYAGKDVTTEHVQAEAVVRQVAPPSGKAGKEKTPEEKKKEIEEILKPIVTSEEELTAWHEKIDAQPCTIVDSESNTWKGDTFLDIHPLGGKTVIEYNMNHPFFVAVYGLMKSLVESKGNSTDAEQGTTEKLKGLVDLLFMSLAQAQSMLDLESQQRVSETLHLLSSNWGIYLRQYVDQAQRAN